MPARIARAILILVFIVAQSFFFFGIADERRLDQDRRDIGRLQYRKAGLFDAWLVQPVDALELAQYRAASFRLSLICAVVDRSSNAL